MALTPVRDEELCHPPTNVRAPSLNGEVKIRYSHGKHVDIGPYTVPPTAQTKSHPMDVIQDR